MNTTQQFATGLMGILMLGTILLMPAQFHRQSTYSASVLRHAGPIVVASEVARELPQEQVRDLTYN